MALTKPSSWPACKHANFRSLARNASTGAVRTVEKTSDVAANRTILKQELRYRQEEVPLGT